MRVYCATLYNETNTFSPMLSDESDFVPMELAREGSPSFEFAFAPVKAGGGEVIARFNRAALPGGLITDRAYESLRDQLLADLRASLPVDLVILNLHGAMVAVGFPDCEGDLLGRVRAIVGPAVPIGASLDPHAHLTPAMTENADILVAYREYPHVDEAATFAEVVRLGLRAMRKEIHPVISFNVCGQIDQYPTTREPMRSLVDLTRRWQQIEGILAVSIIHGFPWGDVPHMGTQSLIVTDRRKSLGAELAADLGARLRTMRGRTANEVLPYEAALGRATNGPTAIVADVADNPGGGAAGDSTYLLRPLLDGNMPAAFGPLWDPFAAAIGQKAGVGARLRLRLGGKVSSASGHPVDVDVTVRAIADPLRTPGVGGYDVTYGRSAWLQAEAVDIVVTSEREQAMVPEMFTQLGISLAEKQVIVVKSAQHFVAGFSSISNRILYASSPGTLDPNFARLPYAAADLRLWPLRQYSAEEPGDQ